MFEILQRLDGVGVVVLAGILACAVVAVAGIVLGCWTSMHATRVAAAPTPMTHFFKTLVMTHTPVVNRSPASTHGARTRSSLRRIDLCTGRISPRSPESWRGGVIASSGESRTTTDRATTG